LLFIRGITLEIAQGFPAKKFYGFYFVSVTNNEPKSEKAERNTEGKEAKLPRMLGEERSIMAVLGFC
jgi:hypothetical protein